MLGESAADYDALLEMVREQLEPEGLQEWLLVKDIVGAEWELLRLSGMKVNMLHAILPRVAKAELQDPENADSIRALVRKFVIDTIAGELGAASGLQNMLIQECLTVDFLTAAAFEHAG